MVEHNLVIFQCIAGYGYLFSGNELGRLLGVLPTDDPGGSANERNSTSTISWQRRMCFFAPKKRYPYPL